MEIYEAFLVDRERALLKQHKVQSKIDATQKRLAVFQTYGKDLKNTIPRNSRNKNVPMSAPSLNNIDYTTTPKKYPRELTHIREFLSKVVPNKGPPNKLH